MSFIPLLPVLLKTLCKYKQIILKAYQSYSEVLSRIIYWCLAEQRWIYDPTWPFICWCCKMSHLLDCFPCAWFAKGLHLMNIYTLLCLVKWQCCTVRYQVTYFNLPVPEVVGAAEAVAWLPTYKGSKQATLAAKNEWIQWRTANKLENSSSWKWKQKD